MARNKFRQMEENVMVIALDRKQAKFFLLNHGAVIDSQKFVEKDEWNIVPQDIKARKMGPDKISRHILAHLNGHLRHVSAEAKNFAIKNKPNKVLIGGNKELFKNFEKLLPDFMQRGVFAEFACEMNAGDNAIIGRVRKIIS